MKFKHNTLIFIAGAVWLAIGIFLLSLGIHFILTTIRDPSLLQIEGKFSIISLFSHFVSDPSKAVIIVITFSLLLGYIKGKMALAKSVKKQIERIASLPNPSPIKYLYSKGYYLLIALMVSLGILMRFFPITPDTRGAIDMVIGSALINGAMLYFRTLAQYSYLKKKA